MGRSGLTHKERTENQIIGRKNLYDDIRTIHVYNRFRDNLRPWDRQLPPIVEQEANRRDLWSIKPPTAKLIFFMMILCIALWQIVALMPLAANWEHINLAWTDTEKPSIVYDNPKVLLAAWVVTHLCSGFALWFLWIAQGFDKHALELAPMLIFAILEGLWCDILFYTHRIDWVFAAWCTILFFIFLCQVACIYKGVSISALFLLPHVAAAVTVIVYCWYFLQIFPTGVWYKYDNPDSTVDKTN